MKRESLVISLMLIALLALVPSVSQAALAAVDASPGADDVTEINRATPGTSKTFLGTRLRGLLQNETAAVSSAGEQDLDEGDAVIRFTTGAASAGGTSETALGNGYSNQLMTFVLVTDGGANVDITPSTTTGFTSVTLSDANDSCTLRYVDSTVGWVVAGNAGCTIN